MNDVEYKDYALKEYGVEIFLVGNDCPKSQSRRHHFENHKTQYQCNKCGKVIGLVKLTEKENTIANFLEKLASEGVREFCVHGFAEPMTILTPFVMIHCIADNNIGDDTDQMLRAKIQELVAQIKSGEITFCRIEKLRLNYYGQLH